MSCHPPHRPRVVLLACAGWAAVLFGNFTACGGPASSLGGGGFGGAGAVGTTTTSSGPGGGSGTSGSAVQYCGVSDGGSPVPCSPPDAGNGGTGHPGDGG
jgi:hypothetical protein